MITRGNTDTYIFPCIPFRALQLCYLRTVHLVGGSLRTLINLQLHSALEKKLLWGSKSLNFFFFFFFTEKERAIAVRNRDFGSPPLSSSFICRNTVPHWILLVKAHINQGRENVKPFPSWCCLAHSVSKVI